MLRISFRNARSGFEPWLEFLSLAISQDTLLSLCLSPSRRMIGHGNFYGNRTVHCNLLKCCGRGGGGGGATTSIKIASRPGK